MARWTGAGGRSLLRVDSAVSEGAHDRSPATSHTPIAQSQAAPPRDPSAAAPTATATLRGRVVAADTGEPLHRVKCRSTLRLQIRLRASPTREASSRSTALPLAPIRHARGPRRLSDGSAHGNGAASRTEHPCHLEWSNLDILLPKRQLRPAPLDRNRETRHLNVCVEALEFRYPARPAHPRASRVRHHKRSRHYRIAGLPPGTYLVAHPRPTRGKTTKARTR